MATHRHPLDPATAERLAAGRLDPDDAPPGYRRVASLLQTAGTAPSPDPATLPGASVGALAAAIRTELAANPPRTSRRPRMLSKLTVGKALIAALSAAALSAGAAGAATGHLPAGVQDKVANAVGHVGVNLPDSGGKVVRVTDGCVPAADGTYARNRGQYLAQERAKGAAALAAAEKTRCGMPVQSKGIPGADDATETPSTPDATSGDHGRSGETHGAPAANPPGLTTPNSGGLDTADTASNGADSTGAGQANSPATDGSGNAGSHPTADSHPGNRP